MKFFLASLLCLIGTTAFSAPIEVTVPPNASNATGVVTGTFTVTSNAPQCIHVSSSGATNPALMVDCANAITGIGTSSPGTFQGGGTPGLKLHVFGPGTTRIASEGTNTSLDLVDTDSSANDRIWRLNNINGLLGFSQLTDALSIDVTALNITAAGNVGIGNSAPATKLHLSSGTFTLDGTSPSIKIGTMTIPGAIIPPNGMALCLSAGSLGHCTTTPTNGACTCVSP